MWIVIFIGILLRLWLVSKGFHGDIITQAGWGKWIFENGLSGFYENKVWTYGWPNHPPIISWTYAWGFYFYHWLLTLFILTGSFIAEHHLGAGHIPAYYRFVQWWGDTKYIDTPFKYGELVSMKFLPIVGDLVLIFLIYKIVLYLYSDKTAKIAVGAYMLSPFSWYESGLWGQNDQLGLVFLILAFLAGWKKKREWLAPIFMAFSIMLKPTAFIFGPLLVWVTIKDKTSFWRAVVGAVLTGIGYYLLVINISKLDFWTFNLNLQKQMFVKGEVWTWVNTFNLWRIITPHLTEYSIRFLGLSYNLWGYILFLGFNIWAFKISQSRSLVMVLKSMFVVGFSGWMVLNSMHERYLFPAIVLGLILVSGLKKYWIYWLLLSLIFWVNMYNGWWTPESFDWLKYSLTFDNYFDGIIPRILAGINLLLMAKMFMMISNSSKKI